ncbi:SsrA-binding protein SmpB [bacterium]|uniref:SsrA-binding protein n=2 Tax=Katanobacteria TaxID=422282 RepID=A0A2M7X2Z8_UNCKA|nr:SsrA-binding protein SmpB [bacterium]PIP56926.1 MAG: SsrA-binding protein [candidate division WWE3 bacterium CG22_combo_CG10-13_8_21_14_all_39_12]PJA40544.1 MAG: SsrA-binding protein [candidate division WWE3 bacterium CG_4_9_14_3_um_filter_39_7]
MATLATHKTALREYSILKTIEAGIALKGTEVKAAKSGHARISESYAKFNARGELMLINSYIGPYGKSTPAQQHHSYRTRTLLLNKRELQSLKANTAGKNLTIVPLRMYTVRQGLIKLELGLAKGKKEHDKRQAIKDRDSKRELDRTLKKYTH